MGTDIIKQFFRFIFFVLLQVVLLNNIHLGGYINPYLYILFILMLPFETPVWLVLILSFLLGLSIDLFLSTMGMHAAATVLMGYSRGGLLKMLAPREGYEFGKSPSLFSLGYVWYFSYASILVALHHFTFFYIEVFRLSEFFYTLFRFSLSVLFTFFLILLSQYLLFKSKR